MIPPSRHPRSQGLEVHAARLRRARGHRAETSASLQGLLSYNERNNQLGRRRRLIPAGDTSQRARPCGAASLRGLFSLARPGGPQHGPTVIRIPLPCRSKCVRSPASVPTQNNPRLNDAAVDAVAASIREFGFRQPIVVDEDGVIIVGHTRYKAALKLGLERCRSTWPSA